MKSGHPGWYCANIRSSFQKIQKLRKASRHGGTLPYTRPLANTAAW